MTYLTHYIEDFAIADEFEKNKDFFASVISIVASEILYKNEENQQYFFTKFAKEISESDQQATEPVIEFLKKIVIALEAIEEK